MLLSLKGINFGYKKDHLLFKNLHLDLERGKILAVVGESGCGKTSLLKIIYGQNQWESGHIYFNGREIHGPKANLVPGEKEMNFVAQNYDLMPYTKVYTNVGKYLSNINLQLKKDRVAELLKIVGLEDLMDEYAENLSGGQKQRVAIAQALSQIPQLLLLDEPFSSLDFSRKAELREELFDYVRRHQIGLIISTHNVTEIMPWIDEIVVLQEGRLIQRGSPKEVYEDPYNSYVARLFGEVNILSSEEQEKLGLENWFYYPHQIRYDENGRQAEVIESGFSGGFYRNLIRIQDKDFVFYSRTPQEKSVKVKFLKNPSF